VQRLIAAQDLSGRAAIPFTGIGMPKEPDTIVFISKQLPNFPVTIVGTTSSRMARFPSFRETSAHE